jgi:hypothetical protein
VVYRPTPEIGPAHTSAVWTKRTALILLVVLGLVFWIPPVLRATFEADTRAANTIRAELTGDAPAISRSSSEPTTIKLRPTRGDCGSRSEIDRFQVTATILGRTRRAAILNGRLFREGDRILAAGNSFRIAKVTEDRVELSREPEIAGRPTHLTIRMAEDNSCPHSSETQTRCSKDLRFPKHKS